MAQVDLFAPELKPPVAPTGRREPRLWVRRVALFADPSTSIRNISLRPGLNIIWTPDMSSSGALAHGSGKTTLCRLIRGCLGEAHFATPEQKLRMMRHYPNGFAAAEVMIDGVCWVAFRHWGLARDYVVRCDSIEEGLTRGWVEGDLTSLDEVITRAFFESFAGQAPADVGEDRIWDVLRAWLTRDQECRLSDILDWRSSKTETGSRAQQLGAASKLAMMRLALRAIDADERKAAEEAQKLSKAVDAERKRTDAKKLLRDEELAELRREFGVDESVGFEDDLEKKGLISLAEAALQEAMRAELPFAPDYAGLLARSETLNEERQGLADERAAATLAASEKRLEAGHLRSEAEIGVTDLSVGPVRVCPVCKVPVDQVLVDGCKISSVPCDTTKLRKDISDKQNKAQNLEQEAGGAEQQVQRLTERIQQIDDALGQIKRDQEQAEKRKEAVEQAREEVLDRIVRQRQCLDQVRRLSQATAENNEPSASQLRLDGLRAQVKAGQERAQKALGNVEQRFRGFVAQWLQGGAEGMLHLDGNGLRADVQFSGRGEISTAALDSLKIVAFDLVALHMAAEDKVTLPAFLIHDSPREADLDAALYRRLFEFVVGWESESSPCSFQYIVTTTTAPPDFLQHGPQMRLEMHSTPSSERLFKVDL